MKALILFILAASIGNFAIAKDIKAEKRTPAAVEEFSGSVEVNVTTTGTSLFKHDIVQIIDRTNNVVCYGKVSKDSSTMSCLPMKSY